MKYESLFVHNNNKWNKITICDFVLLRDLPLNYLNFNLKTLKSVINPKICLYK